MLLSILHLHLPMSQALALLLRFGWIGRMHERGATDTVADRCAVQKMHTAFPHRANMKIGIFHQPDRWVKPVQACQAFTPDDGGTANEKGTVEQHSPGKRNAGSKSATYASLRRRVGKVLA